MTHIDSAAAAPTHQTNGRNADVLRYDYPLRIFLTQAQGQLLERIAANTASTRSVVVRNWLQSIIMNGGRS